MSFREENSNYLRLRKIWWDVVAVAHEPNKGTRIDQLDNLMLASYRLHKCIHNYLRHGEPRIDSQIRVPLLPDALKHAKVIVGQTDGLPSMFSEADALEALSRSCFRWLKDNEKLKALPR